MSYFHTVKIKNLLKDIEKLILHSNLANMIFSRQIDGQFTFIRQH